MDINDQLIGKAAEWDAIYWDYWKIIIVYSFVSSSLKIIKKVQKSSTYILFIECLLLGIQISIFFTECQQKGKAIATKVE